MILGEVATFPRPRSDAGQARKIIEEAYEVYDALRDYEEAADGPEGYAEFAKDALLEEVADVVTACSNLAAALGVDDMRPMIECVRRKNEARGRYDGAKCGTCRHGLRSVVWCDAPTAGGCISGMRNVYEDACAEYEEAL